MCRHGGHVCEMCRCANTCVSLCVHMFELYACEHVGVGLWGWLPSPGPLSWACGAVCHLGPAGRGGEGSPGTGGHGPVICEVAGVSCLSCRVGLRPGWHCAQSEFAPGPFGPSQQEREAGRSQVPKLRGCGGKRGEVIRWWNRGWSPRRGWSWGCLAGVSLS